MVSTPPGPTQPRSCETFRVSRREALAGATKLGLGASFVAAEAARHWQPTTAIAALQGTDRQTLTVAANWAPVDIDPHGAYDVGSGLVISGPFESLIALKPGSSREFVPVLAESWESNEDLSAWTFRLRNGVLFHDGTLCDAEAVRVSFERMFALALPPSNVLKRFIQSIDQIQVLDNQSILFDLGRPQLMFDAAMAAPYGTRIMNVGAALQHEVDGDWGHGWTQANTDGLGTGPYRVTSFEPGDRVVMERFDDYWGGWEGEHFERIVIRVVAEAETRRQLIEQGGADIVENISRDAVESLSRDRSLIVHRQTNFVVHYLAMTVAGPLTLPEARQALCWAFPYEDVLQGVYLGYAILGQGPVSERCSGFAPVDQFTTDLANARALLDQAGIPEGTTLTTVTAPGNTRVQSVAELFQRNLAEIDIGLEIQQVDYATYTQMVYGDLPADERPHLLPSLWQPDYDDAYSQLWPLVSCDAWQAGNIGHYCNEPVDELLLTARDANDDDAYFDALADVQQIVTVDNPAGIYFAQPEWITVLRADVGGFVLHPLAGEILDYYAMFRTP